MSLNKILNNTPTKKEPSKVMMVLTNKVSLKKHLNNKLESHNKKVLINIQSRDEYLDDFYKFDKDNIWRLTLFWAQELLDDTEPLCDEEKTTRDQGFLDGYKNAIDDITENDMDINTKNLERVGKLLNMMTEECWSFEKDCANEIRGIINKTLK